MSKKRRRAPVRAAVASAVLLAAAAASAAPLTLTGGDARAVDTALSGAVKCLESGECRKVFTDFADSQGRRQRTHFYAQSAPSRAIAFASLGLDPRQQRC